MKVDEVTCLFGKRHRWRPLMSSGEPNGHITHELRWCQTCGCTAEFYKERGKPFKRCLDTDPDQTFDCHIPDCHKSGAEIEEEKAEARRRKRAEQAECVEVPCEA